MEMEMDCEDPLEDFETAAQSDAKAPHEASHDNLFILMETERQSVPHALREDYIPIFVVNLLRDKLYENDDSKLETSTALNRSKFTAERMQVGVADEGDKGVNFDDSSFLEDIAESFLLTDEMLAFTHRVLQFGNEAMQMFQVDERTFLKYFVEEIDWPPLELLWLVEAKYGLFSVSSYLMQLKFLPQIQFFQRQFLEFANSSMHFDSLTKDRSVEILEHFFMSFVSVAYCNSKKSKTLKDLERHSKDLLHKITNKLIGRDGIAYSYMNQQFILAIIQEVCIPKSVKKKYFLDQIEWIICSSRSILSLKNLLQNQETFAGPASINDAQPFIDTFMLMIGPPLATTELKDCIRSLIQREDSDWENILRLMTVWLPKAEFEAASIIKDIIKDLLREGLCSKSQEKVTRGFILARHCSLVAPKIFSRYEKWYSHMFESELYSPAKEPESFEFLANLLTEWVPYEPSCFLQVQATFWPFIPTGYREVWNSYVGLAKVQVSVCNEVESAVGVELNPNNPVQYDVDMAIKAYESTRTIPQSVAQMWMFRKQYFLDKFLPLLLKKPLELAQSDARLRLVEMLNKDGKIPMEMYTSYKGSHI